MAIGAPSGYSGVLYYLNFNRNQLASFRTSPGTSAATAPPPPATPLRTSLPARTTAPISQPNAPVLYRPPTPTAAPAPAPSFPALPATPQQNPVSPISGAPVQTSVFQPSQTTASILQQSQTPMFGGSNYQEPQSPIAPVSQPIAVDTSQQQQAGLFGLDQNSIIVILVILAALIAMAVS